VISGALGGGGKHLPAAVVSHEHHVGIHGLIYGVYDAKPPRFTPGGISLTT